MKRPPSLSISIPTPCHESWDKMTPAEKGRFCQSCRKTVIDFSEMNDRQLIELISNEQGKICGRFIPEQLNRVISITAQKKRRPLTVAAVIAALTMGIPSAKAANRQHTIQSSRNKETQTLPSSVDTTRSISGTVLDNNDRPVLFATVIIKDSKHGVRIDELGRFTLRIPENITQEVIILKVRSIGYETAEIIINLNNKNNNIGVCLKEYISGETAINYYVKEHSIWEKLKAILKVKRRR